MHLPWFGVHVSPFIKPPPVCPTNRLLPSRQLLHDERVDKASGGGRRRSSLVIVRSSPDSPTSQHDYIPPTSYTLNTHNTLAPPPVSLAPPQPSTAVRYHALAGSPSKEPPSHKHHRHRHHAYENNI
ncbi:hypothetical protein E2C01_059081 [Portunus trituberculatus]|uniref:Uncharacterized protein n=1 Tax=Portunus trituberculatus TaxID=210409 RepID=A0A5B7H548_PORTR|nr:hypothetical protein [Portunus trituberculatus]